MMRYRSRVRTDDAALIDLGPAPTIPSCPDPRRDDLALRPWLVLCPADVVVVEGLDRRALAALRPGTPVAIRVDAPGSRTRMRSLARASGVRVERELIAVPSTRHPIVLVDDDESAVRFLWQGLATVPPGLCRTAPVAALALRAARSAPWQWTGALAPGRVLVGVRT
jgi:hypothetical protein